MRSVIGRFFGFKMEKKIGIGVIGTGFARRTQIPGFAALDNAEVVSVASGKLENARSAAEEFGIPHHTENWHDTVLSDGVDLVCVTTPPNMHLEMTAFALNHGKHVLCEKPMAMNAEEAGQMTRLAEQTGLLSLIDHELRFTNGRIKAFEMIRAGKIGPIRHAKYLFRNASRGDENLPWTWWSDIEQGGGALGAIASHAIDTFRWYCGAEIAGVFCRLQTHVKNRPFRGGTREVTSDDETMMYMRFGNGALVDDATAIISISLVEAGPYRNRVEFYGTKGALRIEDGGDVYFADMNGSRWEALEIELGPVAAGMKTGGWSRGFTRLSKEIVDALLSGKTKIENAATFEDGFEVQKVLDASRESDRKGGMIVL